jgi:hypothetical protein
MNSPAPARCDVAIAAVPPDTGHLKGGLIEIHGVRLVGMGAGVGSRYRDVDRLIERERHMGDAPEEGSVPAIAGVVAAGRDYVRADPTVAGALARPGDGHVPTDRRVAVPAMAADTGDLSGALIEMNRIRLMGVGRSVRATDRNVDWVEYRRGSVDHGSQKVAVATIAGAAATGRDHVRADPAVVGRVAGPEDGHVPANRRVAGASRAADASDLSGALIEMNRIRLMGVGRRVRTPNCNVDRAVLRGGSVNHGAQKVATAPIAGAVAARLD